MCPCKLCALYLLRIPMYLCRFPTPSICNDSSLRLKILLLYTRGCMGWGALLAAFGREWYALLLGWKFVE